MLAENLQRIQDRIEAAAQHAGRDASEIVLVAVGKTHPADTLIEAYAAGVRHFGENRPEEALEKIPAANRPGIAWHMIGHVQSRKAETVARLFDWVHSLDSLKLAERLDRFAGLEGKTLNVLLECNVSGEASKYGFVEGEELMRSIEGIAALPHLRLAGLMTMAPIVDDPRQARPVFRALRALRDRLAVRFPTCDWHHLSMGMTDDFEVAIEEGATMVRIGRAIFGERLSNL